MWRYGSTLRSSENRYFPLPVEATLPSDNRDSTKAIAINPRYAKAYTIRGISYKYNGQTDRAIADFRTILKLDSSNSRATKELALSH